jgi:hypothetical protein
MFGDPKAAATSGAHIPRGSLLHDADCHFALFGRTQTLLVLSGGHASRHRHARANARQEDGLVMSSFV